MTITEPTSTPSQAKLEANRQNALASTGPLTRRGKTNSSKNALKHGILSKEVLIKEGRFSESRAQFNRLRAGLVDYFQPQGVMEEILVEKITVAYWRLRRCAVAERGHIVQDLTHLEYDRQIEKAAWAWKRAKEFSQSYLLPAYVPPVATMDRLLRYEATQHRSLDKALVQLERLQRQRKGEFIPPPIAINI